MAGTRTKNFPAATDVFTKHYDNSNEIINADDVNQAKDAIVDTQAEVIRIRGEYETPTGAQTKADLAEQNAKDYADENKIDKTEKTTSGGTQANKIAVTNGSGRVGDSDKVDGYHAGNASGNVPISNGTLNTNLNADTVDGKHASEFADKAGNKYKDIGDTIVFESLSEEFNRTTSANSKIKDLDYNREYGLYRFTAEVRVQKSSMTGAFRCVALYTPYVSNPTLGYGTPYFYTSSTSYVAITLDFAMPIPKGSFFRVEYYSSSGHSASDENGYVRNARLRADDGASPTW